MILVSPVRCLFSAIISDGDPFLGPFSHTFIPLTEKSYMGKHETHIDALFKDLVLTVQIPLYAIFTVVYNSFTGGFFNIVKDNCCILIWTKGYVIETYNG